MNVIVGMRLRAPVQFFKAFSHFTPGSLASTTLAVRTVESQEGQQAASQFHDIPRGIQFIGFRAGCASRGKNCRSKGVIHYGTR